MIQAVFFKVLPDEEYFTVTLIRVIFPNCMSLLRATHAWPHPTLLITSVFTSLPMISISTLAQTEYSMVLAVAGSIMMSMGSGRLSASGNSSGS